jgi:hypothetical protein
MFTPKKTIATLAATAALAGGSLAFAAPASAAETEPGTIAEIVSGIPGSGDIAELLSDTAHVDTTAILNALEEVLKDHSVDNIVTLLDTLGVHGL